ncbi:hypothetical protein AQUCO_02400040v1 [Aquilegia coerulea]|uniref:Uncharacterized protein n=1 Tax=Aquilegia coerulea TaxID=218851 RepID=A0A2G5DBV3_AQUCA|nr:hypothetical protein AQUCO_02400040v1 [Aquilegia coerulea]
MAAPKVFDFSSVNVDLDDIDICDVGSGSESFSEDNVNGVVEASHGQKRKRSVEETKVTSSGGIVAVSEGNRVVDDSTAKGDDDELPKQAVSAGPEAFKETLFILRVRTHTKWAGIAEIHIGRTYVETTFVRPHTVKVRCLLGRTNALTSVFQFDGRPLTVADSAMNNGEVALALMRGSVMPLDKEAVGKLDHREAHADNNELQARNWELENRGDSKVLAEVKARANQAELEYLNEISSLKLDVENLEKAKVESDTKLKGLEVKLAGQVTAHTEVLGMSATILSLEDSVKEKNAAVVKLKEDHQAELNKLMVAAQAEIQKRVREFVPVKVAEIVEKRKNARSVNSSSTETGAGADLTSPTPSSLP